MVAKTTVEAINLIYDCLVKNKKGLSFEEIWNEIVENIAIPNTTRDQVIGELYADLVLDHRFMITKEGIWNLKENMQYKELQKQYDYVDQFSTTDNLRDFDTNTITENSLISTDTGAIREWDILNKAETKTQKTAARNSKASTKTQNTENT